MAGTRKLDVTWHFHGPHQQAVQAVEELDALLDKLDKEFAAEGKQVLVLVGREGGTAVLGIGMGGSAAMLWWYDEERGEDLLSRGDLTSESEPFVKFGYLGDLSGYPRWSLIPVAVARDAVRMFAATGELPGNVTWTEEL